MFLEWEDKPFAFAKSWDNDLFSGAEIPPVIPWQVRDGFL